MGFVIMSLVGLGGFIVRFGEFDPALGGLLYRLIQKKMAYVSFQCQQFSADFKNVHTYGKLR